MPYWENSGRAARHRASPVCLRGQRSSAASAARTRRARDALHPSSNARSCCLASFCARRRPCTRPAPRLTAQSQVPEGARNDRAGSTARCSCPMVLSQMRAISLQRSVTAMFMCLCVACVSAAFRAWTRWRTRQRAPCGLSCAMLARRKSSCSSAPRSQRQHRSGKDGGRLRRFRSVLVRTAALWG